MKDVYVMGGAGFVGSAYVRLFEGLGIKCSVIDRNNWGSFKDKKCDVFINAAGDSSKINARKNPQKSFQDNVEATARSLEFFSYDTYVLLSSGDVYSDQFSPQLTHEDTAINQKAQSRYGLYKHLAELLVQGEAKRWLILRMGGFVGEGLKKNAVYDMLHDMPVWLSPQSSLQFINTDRAAGLVWKLISMGVANEIVNLGAKGLVNLGELHQACGSKSIFQKNAPTISYELNLDKLVEYLGNDVPTSKSEVMSFIQSELPH